MSFLHPELLTLALAVPAVAWAAAALWRRRLAAAEAWAARGLWDRLLEGWSPWRLALSVGLLAAVVMGSAVALAQPRWGTAEQTVEREGVDVVFLVDVSASMGARDVRASRLAVAKTLVRRSLRELPGNRFALVALEGDSAVLAPLTTDAAVIDLLLDSLEPGSLPTPGTDLGEALGLLPELFPPGTERHRAAVLLSDGEDHGRGPGETTAALERAGVVVHALGIGTPRGAPVPVPGGTEPETVRGGSGPEEVKRRTDGSAVISRLDEQVLEGLARATGGIYLRSTDAGRPLDPLVRAIAAMDARRIESQAVDTRAERFQWPLAGATLALFLHLALPAFRPPSAQPRRRGAEGR